MESLSLGTLAKGWDKSLSETVTGTSYISRRDKIVGPLRMLLIFVGFSLPLTCEHDS